MRAADPRRGMVLVVVLWSIALLAGLAMAASTTFRGFAGIVTIDRDRIMADALLTAGLESAAGLLAASHQSAVDGVETEVTLAGGSVRARLRDEGGRIDIGNSPVEVLVSLLRFIEVPNAQDVARQIAEWRDAGAASPPSGPASPPSGPASSHAQGAVKAGAAPFTDVRLLARIPGITSERLAALLPLTTVFGSETVDPMTASADVLAALPGMDRERAAAILEMRRTDPRRLDAVLGPARKYLQAREQHAVSVALTARLVDGFGAAAQAVIIRLPRDSEPYRVLSWNSLPPS
jgi:general secretion pathway protein K